MYAKCRLWLHITILHGTPSKSRSRNFSIFMISYTLLAVRFPSAPSGRDPRPWTGRCSRRLAEILGAVVRRNRGADRHVPRQTAHAQCGNAIRHRRGNPRRTNSCSYIPNRFGDLRDDLVHVFVYFSEVPIYEIKTPVCPDRRGFFRLEPFGKFKPRRCAERRQPLLPHQRWYP